MKQYIGICVVFISLSLYTLGILKIWGIEVLNSDNILKSVLTGGFIIVGTMMLTVFLSFFFNQRKPKEKNPEKTNQNLDFDDGI